MTNPQTSLVVRAAEIPPFGAWRPAHRRSRDMPGQISPIQSSSPFPQASNSRAAISSRVAGPLVLRRQADGAGARLGADLGMARLPER
jgi:hypothetical protein